MSKNYVKFFIYIKLNTKLVGSWNEYFIIEMKRLAQTGNLHKMPQTIIFSRTYQMISQGV